MQLAKLGGDAVLEVVGNVGGQDNTDNRSANLLLHNLELENLWRESASSRHLGYTEERCREHNER